MRGGNKLENKLQSLLHLATKNRVSDIHIQPTLTEYEIYFRVPSGLQQISRLTHEEGLRFLSHFKFLASMDIGERRRPQSGSCNIIIANQQYEFRISTISNYLYQESMVLRILYDHQHVSNVHIQLFFPSDYYELERLLEYKSGLILFSGPVGSGKTTTIYHLLREKYSQEPLNIMTMEDPVEIKEPKFLQAEVNEKAGLSYEVLIKQSLRHRPDILVIGEIRDAETAKMVIRSALTGHLVLATIHAKSCVGVIERLLELGVTLEQMRQSLIGILSQRLINKYCPLCRGACSLYCSHNHMHEKKAILFESLASQKLQTTLSNKEENRDFAQMNTKLRKAYGCGYITEKDLKNHQIP
ncbi:MAG: Flp pilus assembly complex ATPase component TadA [Lactobacillales bacterium]|nr:Flp pilus assembly complex ATPase component TadA [Lactobacillales bacterium]